MSLGAVQAAPADDRQDQQKQDQQRNDRHQREKVRCDWENDQQYNDREWTENQRHDQAMRDIETAIGAILLNVFGF